MHKAALKAKAPEQQSIPACAEKMQPHDLILIQKRMRTLYCLAKKNIALLHYRDLTELCDLNGCYDELRTSKVNLEAYLSNGLSRQMLAILASIVRRDTLKMVHASKFFGAMIDETLDISITEQMVCCYRIVGPDGLFRTVFAGIEELASGDAEAVTAAFLGRNVTGETAVLWQVLVS